MKVIPELTETELSRLPSSAEAKIYREFVKDDSPQTESWLVVHSLGLADHVRKPYAEMDFLVLTPRRYVGLEIKGGRVACRDGRWIFTDRNGHANEKPESPIDQAKGAVFALRDFLKHSIPLRFFKYGFASVFPDIDATATPFGTEWGAIPIYSKTDMTRPISEFVCRVLDYWDGKNAGRDGLTEYDIRLLKDRILPDFDLRPSRYERYQELEKTINALTEKQYSLLSVAKDIDRFALTGPAGSGKTFLALEDSVLNIRRGRKTLFVCSRETFRVYVVEKLIPLHFAQLVGAKDFEVCSFEALPPDLGLWEVIVVDEGQDFMDSRSFLLLLDHLEGGASGGRFHIYFDDRQVVGYSSHDRMFLPWLRTEYGFVPLSLSQNCRNVSVVVEATRYLTGIDTGEALVPGAGDEPARSTAFDSPEDLLPLVEKDVERLTHPDEGFEVGDLVILSERRSLLPVLEKLKNRWPMLRVVFSDDFKGQEAEYAICVLGDENEAFDASRSYVAMTRPKKGLSVYLTAKTEVSIRESMALRSQKRR